MHRCPTSKCVLFLSTPSARRATGMGGSSPIQMEFLSTPSARRATQSNAQRILDALDFYPRPPRGGRPKRLKKARGL